MGATAGWVKPKCCVSSYKVKFQRPEKYVSEKTYPGHFPVKSKNIVWSHLWRSFLAFVQNFVAELPATMENAPTNVAHVCI